jgi:hypothetical protein
LVSKQFVHHQHRKLSKYESDRAGIEGDQVKSLGVGGRVEVHDDQHTHTKKKNKATDKSIQSEAYFSDFLERLLPCRSVRKITWRVLHFL